MRKKAFQNNLPVLVSKEQHMLSKVLFSVFSQSSALYSLNTDLMLKHAFQNNVPVMVCKELTHAFIKQM